MSSAKISLGLLQRISEFLADLPEDQLEDLADGRARLSYVRVGEREPQPARKTAAPRARSAAAPKIFVPTQASTDLIEHLEALRSRDEATALVEPLKKAALVDIAKALSIPTPTKLSLRDIKLEIVESTTGRRLDSIAIRGFDGLRP